MALLVRGAAIATVGRVILAVGSVITAGLLARAMQPGELGVWFVLLSLAGVARIIGGLGLPLVVFRHIAEAAATEGGRPRRLWRRALRLTMVGSPVAALTVAGVLPLLTDTRVDPLLLLMLVGLVVGTALESLTAEASRGLRNITLAVALGGPGSRLFVVAALALVVGWDASLGVVAVTAIYGGASLLMAALGIWVVGRSRPSRIDRAVPLLRPGGALLSASVLQYGIAQADLWVASVVGGTEAAGFYGAALRLAVVAGFPLSIFAQVMPPMVAELQVRPSSSARQQLRAAAAASTLGALTVLTLVVAARHHLPSAIFGPEFGSIWPIVAVLSLGHVVNAWSGASGTLLLQYGHERLLPAVGGVGLIAVVLGGSIGFHLAGGMGLAVAAAVGLALRNVLAWGLAWRLTGVRSDASLRDAVVALRALRGRSAS